MMSANTTTSVASGSASTANNFTNLKCQPSTLICREKTIILGDVTIGSDCIIHPTTSIIAKNGPIIIGDDNLIEERSCIINNSPEAMLIGSNNVFEVDSRCEAVRIGHHNILEAKSSVGPNIEVTDRCIVGAGCSLVAPHLKSETIPPNTVISGKNLDRRLVTEQLSNSHSSQLDFLRKILPNYQKLWRPTNSS